MRQHRALTPVLYFPGCTVSIARRLFVTTQIEVDAVTMRQHVELLADFRPRKAVCDVSESINIHAAVTCGKGHDRSYAQGDFVNHAEQAVTQAKCAEQVNRARNPAAM